MSSWVSIGKKILKPLIPSTVRREFRRIQKEKVSEQIVHIRQIPCTDKRTWGVNIIGDLTGSSGLAEASRGNMQCLEKMHVPLYPVALDEDSLRTFNSEYGITLIHTNPDQLDNVCRFLPEIHWENRYVIGEWVWEQEDLPDWWKPYLRFFDEIWTPSEFAAAAIKKSTDMPVRVVPHIINPICDEEWDRNRFGLPKDLFLCLLTFDYYSVMERKNPEGAIRAFKQAFNDYKGQVGLIIKTRNTSSEALQWLHSMLDGWPNIYIFNQEYTHEQANSLMKAADVYLSLHRAEGFGLVLAEAMKIGTPVIATAWSGNMEFMNSEVACMVPATLTTLKYDYPPFVKGSRWAEPDISIAAEYLRRLYDEPQYRKCIADKAQKYIADKLSIKTIAGDMKDRLNEIAYEHHWI